MNKADIIQRLLEEGHITVAEAMTLMSQDPMPQAPLPYYPNPWNDKTNPYDPPYYVTCNTGYTDFD